MDLAVAQGGGRSFEWANDRISVKTSSDVTGGRVSVVEDMLKPGFHLPRHHHRVMTEIFYVLEGSVSFIFDTETVQATTGITVNVMPNTWHEVKSERGGKLITIVSPGGFENYFAELSLMTPEQLASEHLMSELSERYDSWTR